MIIPSPDRSPDVAGTRLTCHADHPAMTVHGARVLCNHFMGYVPGDLLFVGTADRAPERPDGDLWVRCGDRRCRTWNHFRIVAEQAA